MTKSTKSRSTPEPEAAPASAQPWEAWSKAKGTPAFLLAAARQLRRWPVGRVLEEREYDAAVAAAASIQMASPRVRDGGKYGPRPQEVS